MRVVIAGGHGAIGLRLGRLLAASGDQAVGIIRNPLQSPALRTAGLEPLIADLETVHRSELSEHLAGADAVVFAAGSGGKGGSARTSSVDLDAARLLADAAEDAEVNRYLMVSAFPDAERGDAFPGPRFEHYMATKRAADVALCQRDLKWTILRPGRLLDEAGTGHVSLGAALDYVGVPRDDVAGVLHGLLKEPDAAGLVLELTAGATPITEAINRALPPAVRALRTDRAG